jgi:ribose/xylose/arabinose/galactoside ABC-type transport system permease subunit
MVKTLFRKIPGIWLALILLYLLSSIATPTMFSSAYLSNIMQVASFLGVVSLGQTVVVLTGGIDLSVSNMIMATNIIFCIVMNGELRNAPLAFAACAAAGIFTGLVNGVLITRFRVVPMICTLAVDMVIFGLALILTNGVPKGSVGPELSALGTGRVGGFVPTAFIVWMCVMALLWFICTKTVLGKHIYACGSNPTAAFAGGINTDRTKIAAYIISSLCAVVCGILLSTYVNLPSFGVGTPYALNSVAAVVVGGALLTGGSGSVINTVAGVLFMAQINSLTTVMRIPTGGQYVIQALIIILGVAVSSGAVMLPRKKVVASRE